MFTSALSRTRHSAARLARAHPRRLAVVPRVTAVETTAPGRARVRVDGMVCAACAARTGTALRRVPGVHDVAVDLETGIVELRYDSADAPEPGDLQPALDRVVIGKPARRLLARLVAAASRRPGGVR